MSPEGHTGTPETSYPVVDAAGQQRFLGHLREAGLPDLQLHK